MGFDGEPVLARGLTRWRWLNWGLVAGVIATAGCVLHRLDLRNKGGRSGRPATLEGEVNGATWLHETVGLGPLILNQNDVVR
jgi:hypothetical protein